ncbi:hypothetical protein O0L34_g16760 [Tuta absoluta]|nr:hypothetical protein O0L34_g16760 [Tuta absoluta]
MDGGEKEKPSDTGGTQDSTCNESEDMVIDEILNGRKRRNSSEQEHRSKKRIDNIDNASASIAHVYKHSSTELSRNYSSEDKGPFIVHVAREDVTNAGLSLCPIKVRLILVKNHVQNVVKEGIK